MANLQLVAKLVLQAEESKKTIQQIQEQITKAREEQQKFTAEFGETSEQAVEAAGKVKLLEDSLRFAIDPIGAINDELEFTKKKLKEVNKEFGESSPEAQDLNNKVKVLEDSLDALGDPIKFFNDNILKAQKNLASVVAEYGEMSPEAEAAKADLLALEAAQQKVIKASNEQEIETRELASAQTDLIKSAKKAEENQKELGKATDKTTDKVEKLNKSLDENSKSSKDSEKSTGGLFTLLKGAGIIGAAVAAFELFKDALSKNQKVADTVAAVMKTIQNVLGAVVEVIANVITKVSESTNGFDALTKVLKGAITIAFTPLKLLIGGIALFIKEAQLAWENSFFGDGDPATIKQLTESINETKTSLKETAENAAAAGKDIVNNFGEAVSQVGQVVSGVVEGVSEISVAAIYENAKATVALQNSAKLAAAQLQGVVEAYGTQAEKLRQIRDDDRLSIDERIAANNELGEVLKKQQQAQLALVSQRVAAAAAELSANRGSIELQEALINAQNERAAVLNQIAGFQSEQLANEKALAAEAIALAKATGQAENENYLQQKKNAAELITDELAKNKTLQAIRNEERALEIQRLTENVNQFKEGTQARLDAEIELQNKKNELDQEDAVAAKERAELQLQRDREVSNAQVANLLAASNNRKALLDVENKSVLEKSKERIKILRDESDILIKQLQLQRDQEIADAEKAGKSTVEIKEKYKNAIDAVNIQILKSEKELQLAILDENQKKIQEVFKNISDVVSFYSNIVDIQLAKVQKRQDADNKIQKKLLDERKITQEQYEKNIAKINEEAEKKKIKLQKRQILTEKGTAIAGIIINTLLANSKALVFPGPPASGLIIKQNTIQAIIGVASTIAQTAKALQALGQGGDAGGSGSAPSTEGGGGAAPIQPQAETTALPQDQINQLAAANAAVRSYVIESDVTTNQERIVRLNRAARIN